MNIRSQASVVFNGDAFREAVKQDLKEEAD